MRRESTLAAPPQAHVPGRRPAAPRLSPWRYRGLLKHLVLKELKLKYRSSVLGFVWSLANPLLMITVYTLAFKYMMKAGTEDYSYFLLIGLLPWTFFSQAVTLSATAILDNGALLKKMSFPLEVLPVSAVLFSLIQYLLALAMLLPAGMLLYGARPSPVFFMFFVVLFLHILFTIGISFLLSAGTVFYRDIRHLVEIAIMGLFWLTPIVYAFKDVSVKAKTLLMVNPLTAYTVAYQDVLFFQKMPSGAILAAAAGYALVMFSLGTIFFKRRKAIFAELV